MALVCGGECKAVSKLLGRFELGCVKSGEKIGDDGRSIFLAGVVSFGGFCGIVRRGRLSE